MSCIVSALCLSTCGCQSWSQVGQNLPSGSRVAPPGTGSYQVPSSYYNGQKSSSTGAPGLASSLAHSDRAPAPADAGSTAGFASSQTSGPWQLPTMDQLRDGVNQTANATISDAASRTSQVVQASTSRAATALQQYTDPNQSDPLPPSLTATRSISDAASAPDVQGHNFQDSGPPQLDWQSQR